MNARVGLAKIGLHIGDTRIFHSEIATSDDLSLAAFSHKHTLFVQNLKDGSLVKSGRMPAEMMSLDMSPDGSRLLTSLQDGRVILWETRTLNKLFEYGDHPGLVYAVKIAPDGRRALTVSTDYILRIIPIPDK